jgi:hypothetical protein
MAGRPRYPAGPAVGVRRKEPPWKGPWGPDAFGPAPLAELLHALMLPESEGAARIGGNGSAASIARLAELFEDAQRDPALRAALVGILREMERR